MLRRHSPYSFLFRVLVLLKTFPLKGLPSPCLCKPGQPLFQTGLRKQTASLGQKAGCGRKPQMLNDLRVLIQRQLIRHLLPRPLPLPHHLQSSKKTAILLTK